VSSLVASQVEIVTRAEQHERVRNQLSVCPAFAKQTNKPLIEKNAVSRLSGRRPFIVNSAYGFCKGIHHDADDQSFSDAFQRLILLVVSTKGHYPFRKPGLTRPEESPFGPAMPLPGASA
jgi:hypothetical protein